MGIYNVTKAGGMSSYREASQIYLSDGTIISRYDDSNGEGLIGYEGNVEKIEVRVRAPQLVDILVSVSDDNDTCIAEILYCGTFTVIW